MRNGLIAPLVSILLLLACLGQAAPAEEHLRVGLGAFEDGIYSLAAKELWAFTQRAPDDPRLEEVYFLLAELETSRKEWKSAAKALQALVRGGGGRATASAYRLAAIQETLGQPKKARDSYRLYLSKGGTFSKANAHWRLALIERSLKAHALSAKEFEAFLKASKKDDKRRTAAWEELVAELVSAGDKKGALEKTISAVTAPVIKSSSEALLRLATKGVALALELDAPSKEAVLLGVLAKNAPAVAATRGYTARRIFALERAGDKRAALALTEEYLKDGATKTEDELQVLLTAARLQEQDDDNAKALTHLQTALKNESLPETDKRRTGIGLNVFALALAVGDGELAASQALKLIASGQELPAPQFGSINSYLGQRAEASGDKEGALKRYLAVPRESSFRADSLKSAARIYLENGQNTKAMPLVDELKLLDPGDEDTRALALALSEAAGDSKQAVELLREQLKLLAEKDGAKEAELLSRLALQLQGVGDEAGAEQTLNELAKRFAHLPAGQGAAFTLMRKSFEKKEWQRVIGLERVAEGADRDGARYLAAEALVASGRSDLAVGRLEALTAAGPKTAYTGAAHVRLAAIDESLDKVDGALLRYEAALENTLNDNLRAFVEERIKALSGDFADTQDELKDEEKHGE